MMADTSGALSALPALGGSSPLTLGVMGGGQLGRMFVHAAQRMGYFTAVLDPDAQSPAGRVSHHHVQANYDDPTGLAELARLSSAITTEFENVPASALRSLAALRPVAPGGDAVAIAQDRVLEKAHLGRCAAESGVHPAPYAVIACDADLASLPETLFPGILKTTRLGYDGKGQAQVASRAELAGAWAQMQGAPCVLEARLALAAEYSVIVARGADGATVALPVQRNLHRAGILAVTEVFPGNMPNVLAQQCLLATKIIANSLDYVGVLCVEFFALTNGTVVVNEMAPRPHNSGHYSMDACDISQFELQVRALAGLPLVTPRQHSAAVMLNLLGDIWPGVGNDGQAHGSPDFAALLALPGAHLHLYGKAQARPGRKMGHVTITAATADQAQQVALAGAAILGIAAWA